MVDNKNRRGLLPPLYTKFRHKYRSGEIVHAEIVKCSSLPTGKGVIVGKKVYPTMTAAAKSLKKGPVNGWTFWTEEKR